MPVDPIGETDGGKRQRILILGGTAEAVALAARLDAAGHDVTTSLAGRTADPEAPKGKLRIGGFGGAAGLAAFLRDHAIERLIDATHPFARQISENARRAAADTGVPLERLDRAVWTPEPGDRWTEVASLQQAAAALPAGSRVFLALGRQYLDAFRVRTDCHFLMRMVDPPTTPPGFSSFDLVLGKPSPDRDSEATLLSAHRITHVVCRNSGGAAGYGKIKAARWLGLPVFLIQRDSRSNV